MGYLLQALVGRRDVLKAHAAAFQSTVIIELRENIAMIPITDALYEDIEGEPTDDCSRLSEAVEMWAKEISVGNVVGYVEAEYFGGEGGQSAVVWTNGSRSSEFQFCSDAINRVLRLFGVTAISGKDEFDTVGLGACRNTDQWVEQR
jgi:hypothetical protein